MLNQRKPQTPLKYTRLRYIDCSYRNGISTHRQTLHTNPSHPHTSHINPHPSHTSHINPPPLTHPHHVSSIEYPIEGEVFVRLIKATSVFLSVVSVRVDRHFLSSLKTRQSSPLEFVHPSHSACSDKKVIIICNQECMSM